MMDVVLVEFSDIWLYLHIIDSKVEQNLPNDCINRTKTIRQI